MFIAFDKMKMMLGVLILSGVSGPRRLVDAGVTLQHTPPVHLTVASDTAQTLKFAWAAVNMALRPPYDTVQLQAIPRTASGRVVQTAPVQYTTSDSAIRVSATGLVTARSPVATAYVIASVTQDGYTLIDTARIQVTPTPLPSPLATLSIQPQPGGLAGVHVARSRLGVMPFFATMATGNPATDTLCAAAGCRQYPLLVHFTSSNPKIAYVNDATRKFRAQGLGPVTFAVSTIAYGVRKVDSLPLVMVDDYRAMRDLWINKSQPSVISVRVSDASGWFRDHMPPYAVGALLFLANYTGEPVEVTLSDTTHGTHFVDNNDLMQWLPQVRDTIAAQAEKMILLMLDSEGTHVIQYRGLNSGAVRSDIIMVRP